MSVVLITGARGVIGSVLVSRLGNYELRSADLPEVDLRDPRIAGTLDASKPRPFSLKDKRKLSQGVNGRSRFIRRR